MTKPAPHRRDEGRARRVDPHDDHALDRDRDFHAAREAGVEVPDGQAERRVRCAAAAATPGRAAVRPRGAVRADAPSA